jgi:hypothetical protein
MITETDEVAKLLDEAAEIWPDLANERSALLRQILATYGNDFNRELTKARRLKALAVIESGAFNNIWPANWNEDRLADWPE